MIIFYQIYCKNPEITETYVGSTKDLKRRKITHKYECNTRNNQRMVYSFIRDNGGWDNFDFKIINQVEYHNYPMRMKQEQCYIECFKPSLNVWNSFTREEDRKKKASLYKKSQKSKETQKKYYEDNKDKINERNKKDKERINEWSKLYQRRPEIRIKKNEIQKKYRAKKKAEKESM